jgi:cell wall integrity and stress response component
LLKPNHKLTGTAVRSLYQSNGACQDTCSSNYAFAVIQGQSCWCSNYAPGYSVNTLNCRDPCPGYPTEWCGSSSSGLYAYFQLTLSPSGTFARSSARPGAKSSDTPDTSVSGPITTESPSMHTFLGPADSSLMSSKVEAPTSTPPVLTIITTQTIAQASSEQPTVTVTEPAPSPSPPSSV